LARLSRLLAELGLGVPGVGFSERIQGFDGGFPDSAASSNTGGITGVCTGKKSDRGRTAVPSGAKRWSIASLAIATRRPSPSHKSTKPAAGFLTATNPGDITAVLHSCAIRSYDAQGTFVRESVVEVQDGTFGKKPLTIETLLH
jgi:hypothetical protein